MPDSEEESTSLSVNIYEDLDTIVTKETSYNTDTHIFFLIRNPFIRN